MAILTPTELAEIRRNVEKDILALNCSKANLNAAIQVYEDWYEDNKASVSQAVNAATSPFVFSNAEKKKIAAYWLLHKFNKERI